jgi:hypothetical protein
MFDAQLAGWLCVGIGVALLNACFYDERESRFKGMI